MLTILNFKRTSRIDEIIQVFLIVFLPTEMTPTLKDPAQVSSPPKSYLTLLALISLPLL